jgi:hypothetical protein
MSTKSDLLGNQKVYLRKLNKNNKTININIPYPIIKQSGLKPSDYMKVTYRDDQNKITLSKININTDYGEDTK